MSSAHPLPRRAVAGFTLIELMVGMAVGLLATLVIAQVLSTAEGFKRSATSGSDAQINGGLSIYAIQRQLKMAGYGLVTEGAAQGCTLSSAYGTATMPPTLAPVIITAGANGASDSLRILASSKPGFSLPTKLISSFYDPNDVVGDKASNIAVVSALGVDVGDLMALVYAKDGACQVFQVSSLPPEGRKIGRETAGNWNTSRFPDAAAGEGAFLVNLGTFSDISFTLTADRRLRQTTFNHLQQTGGSQDLQSNIVAMKALYGKDTNNDDVVDTYDTVTPTNNAGWLQVRAVRVAVLARSAQYEKEEVTAAMPQWDVGSVGSIAGATACGDSKCIALRADLAADDWKHYRYKVFDTLVPLRNQVWRSDFSRAAAPTPPAGGN
ncbi:PilW family protein [Roseateles violae]|uniref:PilW family protein n=1 Tax=Roseateles violae TaxID=3058042 RepID=A0ABT8DS03_9BURK|nr:PilW family protein [Pelomonas sp. PFR6]MDN3921115.1 PilW family protein [Pelomonas sp. PFR6]